MTTLKDAIEAQKCRKGPAKGTTKRGAFWLACEPITLRRYGGDGIGNSGADCTNLLELRHYRNGVVSALIHGHYWHQNGAAADDWMRCDELLSCETVESVIVELKGNDIDGCHVYSDYYEDSLTEALVSLGLEVAELSPDEA